MESTPKDKESIAANTVEPKPVDWEKRYKDTQKSIQERAIENKQLKAKNDALAQQLNAITTTPVEVSDDIEALKYSDPDKWRAEINRLEQEASAKTTAARQEVLDNASKAAQEEFELERRQSVFTEFQAANPDLHIDDQVLANDIPPSISNKLADGKITFEEFLGEVKTYIAANRTIKKESVMNEPNLGKQAGGEAPEVGAISKDSSDSYKNEIY